MSDIFKRRKTPKHLIIQDESSVPRKRRGTLARLLVLAILILILIWVILQLR